MVRTKKVLLLEFVHSLYVFITQSGKMSSKFSKLSTISRKMEGKVLSDDIICVSVLIDHKN